MDISVKRIDRVNIPLISLCCRILIADVFEPFLRSYLEKFQHQTVTTKEWKHYLEQYFHDKVHITINQIGVKGSKLKDQKFYCSLLLFPSFRTRTSHSLRHFYLQKDVLKQVEWKAWLHKPGLPPVNMIEW